MTRHAASIGRTRWTDGWIDGRWPRAPALSPVSPRWVLLPAVAEQQKGRKRLLRTWSPYDRFGGDFGAIAAVVNRFSDAIITNPKLNENPALKAWNDTQAEI